MESNEVPLAGTIQVNSVGNYPITWEPLPPVGSQASDSQASDLPSEMFNSQPTTSDSGFPSTNAELQRQFIAFIQKQIRRAKGDDDSDPDAAYAPPDINERKQLAHYYSLLAIVRDPSSALIATDIPRLRFYMKAINATGLETAFRSLCQCYVSNIDEVAKLWIQKSKGNENRPKLDRDAQNNVPGWYNKMCVLTGGTTLVEGAHIIDVRVTKKLRPDGDASNLWNLCRNFWAIEELASLNIAGSEKRNILPLRVDAHRFWDSNRLALRPLGHPTDPTRRLYLQVVWLKDITEDGNLVNSQWDHQKLGTITDFRRGSNSDCVFPAVQHGDVYELVTVDEVKCPFPSMHFLQLRYAIQKLLAGMVAAGALKDIFRGPPPSSEGPVRDEVYMPGDWDMLIRSAQEEGVLSVEAEKRWSRYVSEAAYQDHQAWVEQDAEWQREQGRKRSGTTQSNQGPE